MEIKKIQKLEGTEGTAGSHKPEIDLEKEKLWPLKLLRNVALGGLLTLGAYGGGVYEAGQKILRLALGEIKATSNLEIGKSTDTLKRQFVLRVDGDTYRTEVDTGIMIKNMPKIASGLTHQSATPWDTGSGHPTLFKSSETFIKDKFGETRIIIEPVVIGAPGLKITLQRLDHKGVVLSEEISNLAPEKSLF